MRLSHPPLPPEQFNYLMLSDVHLGADLVQHAAPWTRGRLDRIPDIDHRLATLLDHYMAVAEAGRPWKLVLNGDFVDLIGMSISAGDDAELERPPTADERAHGVSSSRDRAAYKMRCVAERHDLVFRKLSAFVDAGHRLVVVRGNHDVELYFRGARHAFVDALVARRGEAPACMDRQAFEAHIEFRQWIYYVDNLLYVEHGHQYDQNCSHPHVLAPLSPADPAHISYAFADVLLRYIVRPTRGLGTEGHEHRAMTDYLRLAVRLGIVGGPLLAYRFLSAIVRLFRLWRAHASQAAHQLRLDHERRMQTVADSFRLHIDKVRAISSLSATPIATRALMIMRSVFLDGLLAIGASLLTLVLLAWTDAVPAPYLLPIGAAMLLGIYLWMRSVRVFDPDESLREGAARIAEILPARYVVMGHTHIPRFEQIADGVHYVNLGMWSTDDLDEQGPPAPCSHLVVRTGGERPDASLMAWDPVTGATPMFELAVSGVHPIVPLPDAAEASRGARQLAPATDPGEQPAEG